MQSQIQGFQPSLMLDETFDDGVFEQTDKEITNEMEATAAAYQIFRNVGGPDCL